MYPDRIEFESVKGRVTVRKYTWPWDVVPDSEEVKLEGFDPRQALAWCEKHGYTVVTEEYEDLARATRNPRDRFDFWILTGKVSIQPFKRGRIGDRPGEMFHKPRERSQFNLEGVLIWLEKHGYTVRRWSNGARAFLGAPWPIRTRREIYWKRQRMEAEVSRLIKANPGKPTPGWTFLDFAFDM